MEVDVEVVVEVAVKVSRWRRSSVGAINRSVARGSDSHGDRVLSEMVLLAALASYLLAVRGRCST